VAYRELGPTYLDELNKAHTLRYHIRKLESLGFKVEL